MMKRALNYFVIISAVLAAGCTEEDLDDCLAAGGLTLHYSYTLNPYNGENRFGLEVEMLSIYVFDGDGLFYRLYTVSDRAQLGNDNAISLPLPEGTWTIVTWGGDMASCSVGRITGTGAGGAPSLAEGLTEGVCTLTDYRLWIRDCIEQDNKKLVTNTLSPLFFGLLSGVRTTSDSVTELDVEMIKDTKTLEVKINNIPFEAELGSPWSLSSPPLAVEAFIANGRYGYNNGITQYARVVHYAQRGGISVEGNNMQADLSVARLLVSDATSTVVISAPELAVFGYTGGTIVIPLVQTIMQTGGYSIQTDLDRENTFTIEMTFELDAQLTITINGWDVTELIPGIQ